jgi:ribonucleotide monophosphatase NagD (HAD superfamily)
VALSAFDIPSDHIMTPLVSIGEYLRETGVHAAYVWGTPSARAYLHANAPSSLLDSLDDADVVVVCYRDDFTYAELCALLTKLATTPYIISNIDRTYPDVRRVLPDVGALHHLIGYVVDAHPVRIFGKPDPQMCDLTVSERSECLMVGDREMTDGKLADGLGCPFFHVDGAHDLAMLHIILKAIHG